ncbi:2-hydroxychromene-2-carboxylate isomerase [Noviherbaspirillum denitrificans]|uniref:2-hydroxychromene-2-carboxylate isomerase n=1 Tax=Noviherbaspirillum denitrificans TaxID=1968433 RepID=A0A254T9G6_9BURK|nr:2-hydroxychromene-2-carboxylate isomerase [Noviherbaspirillum denitrificans]OWW19274.1 2-hydroxychromene-2-carboxylate isomerase [Noviherbaspirillum denitrificans]
MSAPIDFYFDFSSPYGYFAALRIEALAAKYGRTVAWHPVLLGAIFKTTGCAPLPMVPLKGDYSYRDFERTARLHGIPYKRPATFPISTQLAARAMTWIARDFGDAKAVAFAKAAFASYFADGLDITRPEGLAPACEAAGLKHEAVLDGANSQDIKDMLKAGVDAAVARGVFGSPFMIADGEPFWGFDRFDQLEAFLKNGKI